MEIRLTSPKISNIDHQTAKSGLESQIQNVKKVRVEVAHIDTALNPNVLRTRWLRGLVARCSRLSVLHDGSSMIALRSLRSFGRL